MAAARRPELVRKVLDQFRSTQRVGRFAVKGVRPVDEYNMCAVHLMHEPTKAEVLHFARPDNNNAFAVAFATLPTDDTGAPHILEHTVLCGSKKYPTRDPFFKMLNRSLSNFMNALTGPDYTMYPFSTTNAQDFANLMHVYLDAAFFPNLNELDFCQEGWRLEHENVHDKSSPLQFKGVVFNEMKGAFSSSDNLFCMRASQLLHPHTTFSNVSGGEPIAIPDLTYSDLKAFHHLHYHPSNAKFLTYGDMPLEHHLDIIERDVLQHFSAQEKPTAELLTRPWTAPQQHHIHCAHDPNAGDTQTKMSVSFLTPEATGLYESFVYRMLSSLLLDSASSPFYQALIDSGLAPEYSPNTGLDMHTPQASFSVGVQGIRESAVDDVRTAIDATLQRYTNDPFDDQMVQALLHQIEVRQRAVSANFGLHLVTNVVSGWNHGLDPLDMLEIKPIIERFRREYSQDPMLFQKIIRRDFVENPHRLEVVMTPSKSYQEDLDAKEKEKLNAFVSKLKPADVDAIYDRNLELLASQQKERDVSCLPTLHVEDINRSGTYYDPTITSSQPFDLYTNVQPTNGVCYTRAFFDGAGLSYEDQLFLPLFNQMLTTAGVGDISYKEFPQKVQNCMDGLSASCVVSQDFFNPDKFTHGVNVSSLCLSEHAGDAFSLWQRLLVEARLDDHHHLRNIIRMAAADVVSAIADSGHQYAIGLAASQHSAASRLSDAHGGLAHFKFVKRLNAQLEAGDIKIEDVSARLIAIRDAILKTSNLRAMMIADEDAMSTALPTFTNVFTALDAGTRPEEQQPLVVEAGPYAADNRRAAIVFPFNVSYAGCVVPTVPPSDDASAHLSLATSIMTTFLHREIREKGGAYGAGCGYNAGSVRYMTYRDPTPLRSLEKFAEATEWMLNGGFSDDQVDEAKLTCFQKIDAPVSVGSRGSGFFLSQVPVEAREKRRHAVLDATKEDILNAVETHLAPATVQAASTGLLIPAHMAEAVKETGARVFQGDDDNNNVAAAAAAAAAATTE